MIILRQKSYSTSDEYIRSYKDGKKITIPAYINENGKTKKNFSLRDIRDRLLDRSFDLQQAELDRQNNELNIRKKALKGEIGLKEAGRMKINNDIETAKKRINIIRRKQ